jgi:NAD(P)-dependent dehydrogenase (short-subunit alcohol dehydrogenase family)
MAVSGKPQVVVITGASAGVGRAVAEAYGRRGARVGLIARGQAGLDGARRAVEAAGGKAMIFQVDVANAEAIDQAADEVERNYGPIDVWVNNAMVSVFAPLRKIAPEDYRRVTEVTYLGYVYGTMTALRRMEPRDHGVIVQVGSALAYRAIPLQSAYCGAKHAIQGFTESLRSELLHDGSNVKVTMVQLPAHNTPQFDWVKTTLSKHPQPVPPIFQPEVAADAILWAADHAPREVKLGFPTVKAIIANKIAPGLLDRYLAKTNFNAQQTDRPISPHRQDNLYAPVDADRDFGAHGDFSDKARGSSTQWWLMRNRQWLLAGASGVAAAVALARGRDS